MPLAVNELRPHYSGSLMNISNPLRFNVFTWDQTEYHCQNKPGTKKIVIKVEFGEKDYLKQ
jgi:hypothetical protein